MKKRNVVNLIRYYSEKNDAAFRSEAEEIARDFDRGGDTEISNYIMSLLSHDNVFVPQLSDANEAMFEKVEMTSEPIWLPDDITDDLMGMVNVISYHTGINKFLFKGAPGTGKTLAVKHVARILKRDLLMVNFTGVVDSKLGNTAKNIGELFREINNFAQPQKLIILFDEIDALALDRTNSQDHREMGRATSELLRELDKLRPEIALIATTNLYDHFDKALLRRFDAIIDFDRYNERDVMEIGEKYLDKYLKEFHLTNKDVRLYRKIFGKREIALSPGELKNILRSSVAFSNPHIEGEYLRRFYETLCPSGMISVDNLKQQGFTVREIGVLTSKSKSAVDRELKETI